MSATCVRCLRDFPQRPGLHLHGPVSHVCLPALASGLRPVKTHPVWVSPEEQEENLDRLDLPLGQEDPELWYEREVSVWETSS